MKNSLSKNSGKSAIVSVHDVMPETLPRVKEIIGLLERMRAFPVTLLVVPGRQWSKRAIADLNALQANGYELAGHGWDHICGEKTSHWHRLHGQLISGNEAEHLSLCTPAICGRIQACYRWFEETGLAPPMLYVPPAWAMGRISGKVLDVLPFRLYETQLGIYDSTAGLFTQLPVAGYMADTPFRFTALKLTNLVNRYLFSRPLRIAIHPQDLSLPMARDLKQHLSQTRQFLSYGDVVCKSGPKSGS